MKKFKVGDLIFMSQNTNAVLHEFRGLKSILFRPYDVLVCVSINEFHYQIETQKFYSAKLGIVEFHTKSVERCFKCV